jgi:hypothetical protein
MATWKERGVVPDSDDDEDTLDIQSSIGTGERYDGHLYEGPRDPENGLGQIDQEWPHAESNAVYNESIAIPPSDEAVSKPNTDAQVDSSQSSPPRPFRDPRIFFDLDDSIGCQGLPESSPPRPLAGVPAEDEISRSYVRLTSPMSSPLSSAPESQAGSPPAQIFHGPGAQRMQIILDPSTTTETSIPAFEPPMDYGGRTFRQRNPIQLHPYIVEQEKYRRFLKARGMTPMRIAQAADEYSKKSQDGSSQVSGSQEPESQEPESQEPESQEFGMEQGQPMDIEWNFAPPSSAQSIVSENRADDEFPDIDELFRDQQSLPRQRESKRPQNRYSSKSKRHQLSKVHGQGTQSTHRTSRPDSIFDVPASPPRTSSPLLPIPRNITGSMSRTMSNSSSAPEDLEEDEFAPQNLNDLLTPATSVAKPVPGSVLIELDSDSEDPFATEPSVASSSSSDEEVEIRKVSKKIRGVLPASHLRLDQHLKKSSATHREFVDVSPAPEPIRRGVALPKASRASRISSPTTNHGMPFLSEDSDQSENDVHQPDFVMEDNDSTTPDFTSQRRMGFAEEEDKIDAMLPSGKRQARRQNDQPRKKRRSGDASLLPKERRTNPRQIKITEHLTISRKSNPSKRDKGRHTGGSSRRSYGTVSRQPSRVKPPSLGILDVIDTDDQNQEHMPQFIKVAARAARSKRGYGRQSPSKKFIRLASREDTYDAQSVLQDWKNGKLLPRNLERASRGHSETTRGPLNTISDNHQTRFRPPMPIIKPRSQAPHPGEGHFRRPRKLIISGVRQSSMNDFVTSELPRHEPSEHLAHEPRPQIIRKPPERRTVLAPQSRPAQLEFSEVEYSHRYPTTDFRSRKKALDNLYRVARKHRVPESNIQLTRFLDEGDNESPPGTDVNPSVPAEKISRSRKRPPQRMDVGAAVYRQPSEPLVLEFLAPREVPDTSDESNRLQGLGKFGTRYTSHFDIFPLQSGIFFHESTFIGSGRLLAILKGPGSVPSDVSRPCISYRLGEKTFEWGPWNDDVSSDMGVSFDWILDQLNLQCSISTPARDDVVGIAMFAVNYVQHNLTFTDLQHRTIFLSRMINIVTEALDRLRLMPDIADESQLQSRIEVVSIWAALVMQLLQISRNQVQESSITAKIKDLLVAAARYCIELLLRKGLESVRKLYDDLQYLSFRTNGIKKDQYTVHSWVVMIKILGAAQIPRGSFWDVANALLLDVKVTAMNDARLMEKIWYSIFTLLPLCEFDESGVVIFGQRQTASFDNWLLPQKMLKSVFMLYSSSSRQSPSFNDYCRALVSRCHYLIVEWGWWKCNGIIGVIFDFFASQSLGHLRNEEVYKSPHFLEELDTEPYLAVEPEDRCFHIFLKIVALAIKHMRGASEGKGIRNLVFRLLPNHDRQYPKEDALDTRDLASLRNHHDLLCTLYWAAPPDQQPPLALIQELVVADRSHNAACLINLRAWQQLARFILTWCTTSEPFQSLLVWQNTFFFKLWGQFNDEDAETRRQAALLGGELFSETRLRETITRNKTSTMTLLRSTIDAIRCAILSAPSTHAAMVAFNTGMSHKTSRVHYLIYKQAS